MIFHAMMLIDKSSARGTANDLVTQTDPGMRLKILY